MRHLVILAMAFLAMPHTHAQNSLVAYIKDKDTKESIPGAIAGIPGTTSGGTADEHGLVMFGGVPAGKQAVRYSAVGYTAIIDSVTFPLNGDTIIIFLESGELEEVTVSTTRSSRTIDDIPTRIEVIAGEELDEKANMKPGDIRMMLSESTGIQTLPTSATTGNSAIRIQGMDGRYTQVLKDGFPLYSGFSGGLGLLQTPPLDMKQVEIIKGSSSTLYGGGAIAGLINLISKTPSAQRELNFLVNGTSAGGLDVNGFYGQRYGKTGVTVYAARNSNAPYDPSGTGLTAIPRVERYVLNPRLFIYPSDKTDIIIGINATTERRTGGDIQYIKGKGDSSHSYYEANNSGRVSSQLTIDHKFSNGAKASLKNSINFFDRQIETPGYVFDGTQVGSFTELNYAAGSNGKEFIFGANLLTDNFTENQQTAVPLRNYTQTTIGAFGQDTWDISKTFFLESGLRGDYVVDMGVVVLPRLSLLYKPGSKVSSRLGGGLGYKAPTIFTEESERLQYRNVLPVNVDSNKLEKSYGGNWDVNYKTSFADGRVTFSLNQLFFYTHLQDPLMLTNLSGGVYRFRNINCHIDAAGAETNIKIGFGDFKLFLGYTYTNAQMHTPASVRDMPLTPAHHTNSVLMYEVEDKWKVGLEAYYYSRQKLGDGTYGRDYWLCGFMAEKLWEHFSLFINFENFLDSRQTRYGNIYTGSITNPVFSDIYTPLEGFVVNGGIKVKL